MAVGHGMNYRQDEGYGDRVREITGGTGVDHVEVSGPGTLAQSIKAAPVGGHIALIGVLTGTAGAVPTAAMLMALIRGIDAVHGHPVIDRSFPLSLLADAFPLQETGGHFGKNVVEY